MQILHTPDAAPPSPPPADPAAHGAARLAGAVRVVSGLTLLSRFAGLARDVITARLFGDGLLGSAFRAAYLVPNVFRRLFGEGALSAAFLPEYALLKRDDPARAKLLATRITWFVTLLTSCITGFIMLVLALRLWLLPVQDNTALSIKLMLLMLPMMPAVCLTAILAGMLQAYGRFAIPAAAPIMLNLFQIAAGGLAMSVFNTSGQAAAFAVGGAALLASWATVAWSAFALRRLVRWRGADGAHSVQESLQRVRSRFLPALLGLGTLQLNTMLDTLVAMWPIWIGPTMFGRALSLDAASNSILSYTQTLYQFPLGVFGIAVATAVFPLLSSSSDRPAEFIAHLRRGLRLSLLIALPATLGLILVRHDLVHSVFGGGRRAFSEDGLLRAANVLLGFAPGVWAYSLNHVMTRAFYARGDTTTPMFVALACVALNVSLNFVLMWPLREAGLAWATAISATVQLGCLLLLARHKLSVTPLDAPTLAAAGRIVLCSLAMVVCVLGLQWLWQAENVSMRLGLTVNGWRESVIRLASCVGTGAGAYALAAWMLKCPELRWLGQRAPRSARGDASGMSFE